MEQIMGQIREQLMHRMKAPEGMTAISFDGKSYEIGSDGTVEVPQEAAINFYPYGLTDAPAPAPEQKTDAPAPAKKK